MSRPPTIAPVIESSPPTTAAGERPDGPGPDGGSYPSSGTEENAGNGGQHRSHCPCSREDVGDGHSLRKRDLLITSRRSHREAELRIAEESEEGGDHHHRRDDRGSIFVRDRDATDRQGLEAPRIADRSDFDADEVEGDHQYHDVEADREDRHCEHRLADHGAKHDPLDDDP